MSSKTTDIIEAVVAQGYVRYVLSLQTKTPGSDMSFGASVWAETSDSTQNVVANKNSKPNENWIMDYDSDRLSIAARCKFGFHQQRFGCDLNKDRQVNGWNQSIDRIGGVFIPQWVLKHNDHADFNPKNSSGFLNRPCWSKDPQL
jgi:hypothetical protein